MFICKFSNKQGQAHQERVSNQMAQSVVITSCSRDILACLKPGLFGPLGSYRELTQYILHLALRSIYVLSASFSFTSALRLYFQIVHASLLDWILPIFWYLIFEQLERLYIARKSCYLIKDPGTNLPAAKQTLARLSSVYVSKLFLIAWPNFDFIDTLQLLLIYF